MEASRLVGNQALFDRTDWLPVETQAPLLFYGGQLNGRLLAWLSQRPRASRVVPFPDYDGVGLNNFARLYAQLGAVCECWLMPDWRSNRRRSGYRLGSSCCSSKLVVAQCYDGRCLLSMSAKSHNNGLYKEFLSINDIKVTFNLSTPAEVQRALGARLREQRLAQSLTQRDLAQMAGLSLGALRKLESDGQCSLETLVRVTQALGLLGELDDLFVLKRQSIAQMERVELAHRRQRAPRKRTS